MPKCWTCKTREANNQEQVNEWLGSGHYSDQVEVLESLGLPVTSNLGAFPKAAIPEFVWEDEEYYELAFCLHCVLTAWKEGFPEALKDVEIPE